jgi:hypothetical protein
MTFTQRERLLLNMGAKIVASHGTTEIIAVDQANDILKALGPTEIELGEPAATIFSVSTKTGTADGINAAVTSARNLFGASKALEAPDPKP